MGVLVLILIYAVMLVPALFVVGVFYEVLLKLPLSPRARWRWFIAIVAVLCAPVMFTYLFSGGIVPNAVLLAAILFGHRDLALDYVLFFWVWIPGAAVTALIAGCAPERWFVARKAANGAV